MLDSNTDSRIADCPADSALGTTLTTDFTKGASSDWSLADGTTLSYGSDGAEFTIKTATDAPTISSDKYIFFGKVDAVLKAAPGTGIVSSFILESDDLDEIDWEWLGSTDSSVESNFFGKVRAILQALLKEIVTDSLPRATPQPTTEPFITPSVPPSRLSTPTQSTGPPTTLSGPLTVTLFVHSTTVMLSLLVARTSRRHL